MFMLHPHLFSHPDLLNHSNPLHPKQLHYHQTHHPQLNPQFSKNFNGNKILPPLNHLRIFSRDHVSFLSWLKNSFSLTWLRVRMSYHRYNNLAELLNQDLAAKIGRGIFSKDLMDRECNCSLQYKINGKCVYEGKCRSKCIIYEVKYSTCKDIYIGNTQQNFKKRMDVHFPDLQRLLKNGQKSDSFAAHFLQHFNSTTSRKELHKCMMFKVINQLNPIGTMKKFTKPNCNLCMQEILTILKMLRDKRVTVMNKNLEIYGAFRHKTCFHIFCLSTDDPIFNG